jgi:hypothetical protein
MPIVVGDHANLPGIMIQARTWNSLHPKGPSLAHVYLN